MAFIPAPNTLECELRFALDSQKVENTLYFHKATAWNETEMSALALDLANWWATNIAPHMNQSLRMTEIKVSDLSADDGQVVTYVPPTTIEGGDNGAPMPNNVAFCVKFNSSARGRSARGRNYLSGWSDSFIAFNNLPTATANAIVAAYDLLLSLASDNGATWVIVSRFHNKAPRATAVNYQVTSASYSDTVMDSQRRRLPGRGQ